jgi:tryptophan synthase alpha chain
MSSAAMMGVDRIRETFASLDARGKKALIAYLCVGDPSIEDTIENAIVAVEAGADLLELGVPYSDPVADGPVLEQAAQRAIAAGGSLRRTLDAAAAIRARTHAPLVLFTYFNPLFVAGPDVLKRAAESGIDALLVVDLPADEGREFREKAREYGLAMIPLVTPTSTEDRLEATRAGASGFVYYVSLTGITGAASAPLDEASRAASTLRGKLGLPVVVGFGIDSPEKARAAAGSAEAGASGVVVGTALVRAIHEAKPLGAAAQREATRSLISRLRAALLGALRSEDGPPFSLPRSSPSR